VGKNRALGLLCLVLLLALLAACAGYTQSGSQTTEHQDMNGGDLTAEIGKANGTAEQSIEVEGASEGTILDTDVTLAVGMGMYRIELLGPDGQVTLSLEARDGQTVEGHGQMVTDAFGEASYRVTAENAENVDYQLVYTFQ
jgi:hypothetical protein